MYIEYVELSIILLCWRKHDWQLLLWRTVYLSSENNNNKYVISFWHDHFFFFIAIPFQSFSTFLPPLIFLK